MSFVDDNVLRVTVVFCLITGAGSTVVLATTALVKFLPRTYLNPFTNTFISQRDHGDMVVNTSLVVTTTNNVLTLITFCVRLPM